MAVANQPRIMVFRPTMEEMKDFAKYIAYIESQGANKAGVAKIIPPDEYRPRKNGYEDIGDFMIPAPIQQIVEGNGGLYQQLNLQKKPMSVREYRILANSVKFSTPPHFDYADLIRKFWNNITFNPPIYGADISGSVYDLNVKEFNINHLNTILDMVDDGYGVKIEGVNTAYLYFGMWKTTFAWHTEDMDLYSINYLHEGAPKTWYGIPPDHGRRLERLAVGFFPSQVKDCQTFLRHKTTLISPNVLKQYGIPFDIITQERGEFMITFPYGYHAGFNHGYNLAESTNFAMPRWVEYGKRATMCRCSKDNVKIDMDIFIKTYQPDRYSLWLAGQDMGPHPEDSSKSYAAPLPLAITEIKKKKSSKRHPIHPLSPEADVASTRSSKKASLSSDDPTPLTTNIKKAKDRKKRPKKKKEPPKLKPFWDNEVDIKNISVAIPPEESELALTLWRKNKLPSSSSHKPSVQTSEPPLIVQVETKSKVEARRAPKLLPEVLSSLWQFNAASFIKEVKFNNFITISYPHCAICSINLPLNVNNFDEDKVYIDPPSSSQVYMPSGYFESSLPSNVLNSNQESRILVCTDCEVSVHAACYGVLNIPEKKWKCSRCVRQDLTASCTLCHLRGGALKPTTNGQWAHLLCSLFLFEVFFEDSLQKEPINLTFISTRERIGCCYCTPLTRPEVKHKGACIKCSVAGCNRTFHVTCGHVAGVRYLLQSWPAPPEIVCTLHQ